MSFRDDLDAAHARIAALEGEVERLRAEVEQLRDQAKHLDADAAVGRKLRLEAEKGKKAPVGDGGVQITGEVAVPTTGGKNEGLVVFYGRLASSPWMTWTKATKPQ